MTTPATETRPALTMTFTMTGKVYKTDAETLAVLRSCMPGYEATGDASAITCVMTLGLMRGRIVEI